MNKLFALILFSLGVFGTQAVLSFVDSKNSRVIKYDPVSGMPHLPSNVKEELSRDEEKLRKVYRQIASEEKEINVALSPTKPRSVEEYKAVFLESLKEKIEKQDRVELLSLIEKEAYEKGLSFIIKKDLIISPNDFRLSDDDLYQMVLKDLLNFPPQVALSSEMSNPSLIEDKLMLAEKIAQDEYLLLAFQVFLEHNRSYEEIIEDQTSLIIKHLEKNNDDNYIRLIQGMKESYLKR